MKQMVIESEGKEYLSNEKGHFRSESGPETEVAELLFPSDDHQVINLNFCDVLLHT
jgi:hypothetical protein